MLIGSANTFPSAAHNAPERAVPTKEQQSQQRLATQEKESWGEDGFSFDDFFDMINPLQHIPVLSHIYREVTGDTIAPAAQIVGGGLFGGITGVLSGVANAIINETSPHNNDTQTAAKSTTPAAIEDRSHREPRYGAYPTNNNQARIYERMDRFS